MNIINKRTIQSAVLRRTIMIIAITTIGIGIIFVVLWVFKDTNPIPKDLRTNLSFSPLVIPLDSIQINSRDYELSKAEDGAQILSYNLEVKNYEVIVSEYVQPPEFTDITGYRDRFLTNVIAQHATVQTANGTIYLGTLSQSNGEQIGVMIEKGLMVFMRPSAELDEMTWRFIGDRFVIVKGT